MSLDNKVGKELYEFGPFRVDAEREILFRAGEPVALPPKTFQVLLVLIRHNQEIVTKDDLMKEVWPETFVEEANLSRNVFLLRKALGESPQDHRYVLTVPGRGYRLAESVRLVPDGAMSIVSASQSKVQIQVEESTRWPWFVGVAVLLLLVIGGMVWSGKNRTPALTAKDTLVLADFSNSTGDSVFDATLRQGLSVQLQQSPYLSLVSDEHIQRTLKLMGQPQGAHLTSEIARGVCERTGSAAVLEGSIASLGSAYVLGLRAIDCRSGEVLDEEQAQALRKEDVLNVLSQIVSNFRQRVGESLTTVQKHSTPLPEATTLSLEALRAYSLGWNSLFGPAGEAEALPFFKRAVEIDPNFASAYAMLGRIYFTLGESGLATENLTRAYQLRDRTSDPERYFIISNYEWQVTGNLEKTRQALELWAEAYPRHEGPFSLLSFLYQALGKNDKSAEAGEKAVHLNPDSVPGNANLAWAYVFEDKLPQAEDVIRRATDRKLEFPDLYILLYDIAFLKNDPAGMQRAAAMAEGKSGAEHWITQRQSCVLAYSGRLKEATSVSRRAAQLAQQAGQTERAALYLAAIATREALIGNKSEASRWATAALNISTARDVKYGAAFAFALAGEEARVLSLLKSLEESYPEDTYVKFVYVPTLRAILAENHRNYAEAVEQLESEAPYDLEIPGTWAGFFGDMYPVYVRGLAYLGMNQPQEAFAQFQKIIDHRGIVGSDPVGALAQLQMARALAAAGDKQKSKALYDTFLRTWKNADSDVAIFKKAQSEFGRLATEPPRLGLADDAGAPGSRTSSGR